MKVGNRMIVGMSLLVLLMVLLACVAHGRDRLALAFVQHGTAGASLQVFHSSGVEYREQQSVHIPVARRAHGEHLSLPYGGARSLRFDPPVGGVVDVCGIELAGMPSGREILHASEVDYRWTGDCLQLRAAKTALDPQISLRLPDIPRGRLVSAKWWRGIYRASVWLGLLVGVALLGSLLRLPLFAWDTARVQTVMRMLEERLPQIALVWLLLLGGLYAVITPPGAVADEAAHLAKVARVHAGVLVGGGSGVLLADLNQMYGPFGKFPEEKAAFAPKQLWRQLAAPMQCTPQVTTLPAGANGYSPHQYLPATVLFAAACSVHAPFGAFLYGARVLNLLLATWLVWLGVSWARRGRWALFAVAILPMSLFQMASVSADSLWLGASLAWLGLISALAARAVDGRRAFPWLLGLALCIALLKPGAAWVLVAFWFARPAFANWRSFTVVVGGVVLLPWCIHVGWTLLASGSAPVRGGVDVAANMHLLAGNPLQALELLAATYMAARLTSLSHQAIGVLGWLDVPLSNWAYPLAELGLAGTLLCNVPEQAAVAARWGRRLLTLLVALGVAAMTALPLFLYWTLPGAAYIEGLQGRYYLVVLAFVLMWASFGCRERWRLAVVVLVAGAMLLVGLDGAMRIFDAYYVSGR